MSSTAGGGTSQQAPGNSTGSPAARLGFTAGTVVQELGWDSDTDDELRVAIEDAIDADMVDGDYGNVVDAVLLWWRDDDGDLVDGLVDALTDLVGGGSIWLLTPEGGAARALSTPPTSPRPPRSPGSPRPPPRRSARTGPPPGSWRRGRVKETHPRSVGARGTMEP